MDPVSLILILAAATAATVAARFISQPTYGADDAAPMPPGPSPRPLPPAPDGPTDERGPAPLEGSCLYGKEGDFYVRDPRPIARGVDAVVPDLSTTDVRLHLTPAAQVAFVKLVAELDTPVRLRGGREDPRRARLAQEPSVPAVQARRALDELLEADLGCFVFPYEDWGPAMEVVFLDAVFLATAVLAARGRPSIEYDDKRYITRQELGLSALPAPSLQSGQVVEILARGAEKGSEEHIFAKVVGPAGDGVLVDVIGGLFDVAWVTPLLGAYHGFEQGSQMIATPEALYAVYPADIQPEPKPRPKPPLPGPGPKPKPPAPEPEPEPEPPAPDVGPNIPGESGNVQASGNAVVVRAVFDAAGLDTYLRNYMRSRGIDTLFNITTDKTRALDSMTIAAVVNYVNSLGGVGAIVTDCTMMNESGLAEPGADYCADAYNVTLKRWDGSSFALDDILNYLEPDQVLSTIKEMLREPVPYEPPGPDVQSPVQNMRVIIDYGDAPIEVEQQIADDFKTLGANVVFIAITDADRPDTGQLLGELAELAGANKKIGIMAIDCWQIPQEWWPSYGPGEPCDKVNLLQVQVWDVQTQAYRPEKTFTNIAESTVVSLVQNYANQYANA